MRACCTAFGGAISPASLTDSYAAIAVRGHIVNTTVRTILVILNFGLFALASAHIGNKSIVAGALVASGLFWVYYQTFLFGAPRGLRVHGRTVRNTAAPTGLRRLCDFFWIPIYRVGALYLAAASFLSFASQYTPPILIPSPIGPLKLLQTLAYCGSGELIAALRPADAVPAAIPYISYFLLGGAILAIPRLWIELARQPKAREVFYTPAGAGGVPADGPNPGLPPIPKAPAQPID